MRETEHGGPIGRGNWAPGPQNKKAAALPRAKKTLHVIINSFSTYLKVQVQPGGGAKSDLIQFNLINLINLEEKRNKVK